MESQTSFRRFAGANHRLECRESSEHVFSPDRVNTEEEQAPESGTMGHLFRAIDWPIETDLPHVFSSVERLPGESLQAARKSTLIKKPYTRTFAEFIGRGFKERLVGWKEKSKGSIGQQQTTTRAPRASVVESDAASIKQSVIGRPSFSRDPPNPPCFAHFRDLVAPITISEEGPDSSTRRQTASRSPKRKFQIRVYDGNQDTIHKRQKSVYVESKKKMSKSPEGSLVKVTDSQILSEASHQSTGKRTSRFSVMRRKDDTRTSKVLDPLARSTHFSMAPGLVDNIYSLHKQTQMGLMNSAFQSPQESPMNTKRAAKVTGGKKTITVLATGLEPVQTIHTTRLSRINHKLVIQGSYRAADMQSSNIVIGPLAQ
jgi:hypothetical protein